MEDDILVAQIMKNRAYDPSSRDARFFDEAQVLLETWKPEDLNAIAISIGPGMFTSLRVGLSLAKGIACTHGTPVVAVNTLDAMGCAVSFYPGIVGVIANAFHKEMYVALYERGVRRSDHMLMRLEDIPSVLARAALVIGPGIPLLREQGCFQTPRPGGEHNIQDLFPTAENVVYCALPRIHARDFCKIEVLEPFYIKKTDAERLYDTKDVH
jgi:tRNA threonylcarbamoyladenosine biosynthesis protein TsaB